MNRNYFKNADKLAIEEVKKRINHLDSKLNLNNVPYTISNIADYSDYHFKKYSLYNKDFKKVEYCFRFNSDLYVNHIINDIQIGNPTYTIKKQSVFTNIKFHNVIFKNCTFSSTTFKNCTFENCFFDSCESNYNGIIFEECIFTDLITSMNLNPTPVLSERHPDYTVFSDCSINKANFINCNCSYVIFTKTYIFDSLFETCILNNTIFNNCELHSITYNKNDITTLNLVQSSHLNCTFENKITDGNDNAKIYISRYTIWLILLSKFLHRNNPVFDLFYTDNTTGSKAYYRNSFKVASLTFKNASTYMSKNILEEELCDEYRYLSKVCLMHSKKEFGTRIISYINWLLFGFGEKLNRLVLWIAIYILGFALLYMFSGIQISEHTFINYTVFGGTPVALSQFLNDFTQCILFSIITASTIGYGHITPDGSLSLIFTLIQVFLGVILTAFFTSMLINKFIRD